MNRTIDALFSELRQFEPVSWSQIPDIGLYMDQVITFIDRTCRPLYGPEVKRYLSPAMINNYVKGKLIPRPIGKKYGREQLALLFMIVVLKQVCSMEDIRGLLTLREGQTVEALYESFCRHFSQVIQTMQVEPSSDLDAALGLAICACGYRVGCEAAMKAETE